MATGLSGVARRCTPRLRRGRRWAAAVGPGRSFQGEDVPRCLTARQVGRAGFVVFAASMVVVRVGWVAASPPTTSYRPPLPDAGLSALPASAGDHTRAMTAAASTAPRPTSGFSTIGWTSPSLSPSRQRGRGPQQRDRVTDFQVGGGRLHVSAVTHGHQVGAKRTLQTPVRRLLVTIRPACGHAVAAR